MKTENNAYFKYCKISIDEPGIMVGPNTLPFLRFSISALTLTYYDARNQCDASREHSKLNFR